MFCVLVQRRYFVKYARYYSTTKHAKKEIGYWKQEENVENFLQKLKLELNLKTPLDWNSVTHKEIHNHGGGSLFRDYTLYNLKCLGCPEGKSIFNNKIPGYWKKEENIKQYLRILKEKLNLNTINDWNSLTKEQILSNGGNKLLKNNSLYEIKCIGCPEGKSIFLHESNMKIRGYWNNKEYIKHFIEKLRNTLNLDNSIKKWDSIQQSDVVNLGGSMLLKKYSMYDIRCMGCPEGKLIFKSSQTRKVSGFWQNEENIKEFLMELKEKLNLNSIEDWNSLTKQQIILHGGSRLLGIYSVFEIKCFACPEGKSFFDKSIEKKPMNYWKSKENIQEFLCYLKEKLKLNSPNDWNLITTNQIRIHGGTQLLKFYSLYEIKCLGCPEGKSIFFHEANKKSSDYWDHSENIQLFLNNFTKTYQINSMDDWNRISLSQIRSYGGSGLLSKYSKLDLIKKQFNLHSNEINVSNNQISGTRSTQRWLFLQIQTLFPGEEIIEDYFHNDLSRNSKFSIQFDIFLVDRNIAFEYHGRQHYEDIPSGFAPLEMYKCRDLEKESLCKKFGVSLIIIPYWWDNSLASLREIINMQQPNISPNLECFVNSK